MSTPKVPHPTHGTAPVTTPVTTPPTQSKTVKPAPEVTVPREAIKTPPPSPAKAS
ncbi:MAG: hypothetical protein MUO51_11170 [Woeseiaceae bacterium]|nr:hypothetical protein [Woeseiaceae bacterium]